MTINRNGFIGKCIAKIYAGTIWPNTLCSLFWSLAIPLGLMVCGVVVCIVSVVVLVVFTIHGWFLMQHIWVTVFAGIAWSGLCSWYRKYHKAPTIKWPTPVVEVTSMTKAYINANKKKICPLIKWVD